VCSPSYLWEVPGKRVAVRLNLEAIDGLSAAVMLGFPSRYGRGREIGGLLLGRTSRQGQRLVVEIEDFEPIRCEHAFGPSLLLSPDDRRAFEEQLGWRRSAKKGGAVVGFWRSHTRRGFELAVEDADLFASHFSRASDVFLIIGAGDRGPSSAGFIIREGGKIRSNSPYLEFPFDRGALLPCAILKPAATPPLAVAGELVPVEPASAPPSAPVEPPPSSPSSGQPVHFGRASIMGACAGLAVLLISLWIGSHPREAAGPLTQAGPQALQVSGLRAADAPQPVTAPAQPDGAPPVEPLTTSALPTPSDPNVRVSTEYVTDEPHGLLGRRRKIPDFEPPALLRAASPQIPADLRPRITREIAIDVKLYVNPSGRVDYAELSTDHTVSNRDLETLAVFAGRKWEFAPARIAGRNAPSEAILHFRFAPATSAGLARAASSLRP